MAEPLKQPEDSPHNADEARRVAERRGRSRPAGPKIEETVDTERSGVALRKQIRAHTNHPHKGDVGRPGTNEEVFQGSKQKELKPE
jgi:hypothetical protein